MKKATYAQKLDKEKKISMPMSFPEAVSTMEKELELNMNELQNIQEDVEIKEGVPIMKENKTKKEEELRRVILFRTYSNDTDKVN